MKLLSRLKGRRVGVVLSAGYFGFYGHAGFVDGLRAEGVVGDAWSGTSAGGMIAAFAASGAPADTLITALLKQRRSDFWDPDWLGLALDAVKKGHRTSGLLRGNRFLDLLTSFLPVKRFEALVHPLVLVATNLSTRAPLLLTRGDVPSAVHATCAYPGLFQAVRRDGQLLWDGGMVDKAPVLALVDAMADRPLDVLLVHHLPSRDGAQEPSGPLAYASGVSSGFAAIRHDHLRLQLEVLKARGVEVHVINSDLPEVSPKHMERGRDALEAARDIVRTALHQPPPGAQLE